MKLFAPFLLAFLLASATIAAAPDSPIMLQSARKVGQTDRVVISVQVGGDAKYAETGKSQKERISVERALDYFEKTLDVSGEPDGAGRSVRDYQKASGKVTVGKDSFELSLPGAHRLIGCETSKQSGTLFPTSGNLTRDELDAIEIQANSLLLDRLLPDRAVAVGDRWAHSPELMAAVLGLDEVTKCAVMSTLKDVDKTRALCEMTGDVEGTVHGAATKIDVKCKYRMLLATKRIDWVGMLLQENRKESFVDDGLEVVSRIDMRIKPVDAPDSLADAAVAKLPAKATPEVTALEFRPPGGGWQFRHDRQWFPHDRPKGSVIKLRRAGEAESGGQCIISSLPQREPEKLPSREDFQDDIRRALDKNFGEFVEASESANEANCRVYRAVVHGTTADIPMRWIYYLVADSDGRQAAIRFVLEQKLVDSFGDADKLLVQSMRFAKK